MQLSEGVESALHLCVLLAAVPDHSLPARTLAEFHGLAPAATAKLLQQLAGSEIVEARAGRAGGYALARPPAEITVGEIVAAAGDGRPAFACREIRRSGPCAGPRKAYSPRCAIALLMDDAEAAWWRALDQHTLASLAARVRAGLHETVRVRTRSWLGEHARIR